MSQGAFETVKYLADSANGGGVYPVKVQPETYALTINAVANAVATGTLSTGATLARVSGSKRRYGLKCRTVRIQFTGTVPTGFKTGSVVSLPVFTPTAFAAYTIGQTGTYLANAVRVVGRSSESLR